jgi:hypothetical protein
MPDFAPARAFMLGNWIRILFAVGVLNSSWLAVAQNDPVTPANASTNAGTNTVETAQIDHTAAIQNGSADEMTPLKKPSELRLGPFNVHPRLSAGLTYDDNILLASANKEADTIWMIQPALQAVAGDDAALIAYRDQHSDVLGLSPGNLIIQEPEDRPGKLLILDYGPGFQLFDKYTANNFVDEFATFNVLWPMDKLILGLRQDYSLQKIEIIEFDQRTTVETIPTTLSAAYQFDDKSSAEADFRRFSIGYEAPGLTGYTEYNTEEWYNYKMEEKLALSLGVLAGVDRVANYQNQTFEQVRARARYDYSRKLSFDVSFGGELRQFENGLPETLTPVFNIAAVYQLTERTSLRLNGFRQQFAAIYNGYNYATTGATLEVRQGITDRFTTVLSMGYYSIDYTPILSTLKKYTGNYYVASVSLDAKIVRHLSSQIFYQRVSGQSQINPDVNDDQVGIQLNLSF